MENNNINSTNIESTFSISPTNQQITLNPGQTYEGSIQVTNSAAATTDFDYLASVTPYSVVGSNYAVDLSEESEHTSISKWITIEEPTGTIPPNSSHNLKFTINVPENAPIGGQYATIVVSSNPEAANQEGINIQSIYEIASIIYANINGEIIHRISIQDNSVPSFTFTSPITLGATITNEGNTHEVARLTISATDYFSGRSILPDAEEIELYDEFVMPGTVRHVSHDITNLPTIGVVKVVQTIDYNDQSSTVEKSIIICPIWFIILVILTLSAIITTIIVLIRRHRRNKYYDFA